MRSRTARASGECACFDGALRCWLQGSVVCRPPSDEKNRQGNARGGKWARAQAGLPATACDCEKLRLASMDPFLAHASCTPHHPDTLPLNQCQCQAACQSVSHDAPFSSWPALPFPLRRKRAQELSLRTPCASCAHLCICLAPKGWSEQAGTTETGDGARDTETETETETRVWTCRDVLPKSQTLNPTR